MYRLLKFMVDLQRCLCNNKRISRRGVAMTDPMQIEARYLMVDVDRG